VETQYDLLSGLLNIQNVTDVVIMGLFDLEQAHVRVLNEQFQERTVSETVATARLYCDGTNKLRLQLNMTRPTALKVAYATQEKRTTMAEQCNGEGGGSMLSCHDDLGLDFHRSSPVGVLACCDPPGNPPGNLPCSSADRVPVSGKRRCTAALRPY